MFTEENGEKLTKKTEKDLKKELKDGLNLEMVG